MDAQMKGTVIAADRFSETMPADGTFLASYSPHQVQAMQRQIDIERDIKAELQAQLKEEEQYRRKIEGERDREKAMRQAAESQVAIWQETEKKMRRDLEKTLTQEELRRREIEQDRDKAHNQRRAAEVDLTLARQQLLQESQLRRAAEEKLLQERDQNGWYAKFEALEAEKNLLQERMQQREAEYQDLLQEIQRQKESLDATVEEQEEQLRKRQAEIERLIEELRQLETQKAVELADVENLRRTATKEKETALKTTAQAKKEIALAIDKQNEADALMEETRELKVRLEKEMQRTETAAKSSTEAQEQAKEAQEAYEEKKAHTEKVQSAVKEQKSSLDALEASLEMARRQLEEDKATDIAAREEWNRILAKTKEDQKQWEASKVKTQKLWTEWAITNANSILDPSEENMCIEKEALSAYKDAEDDSERQFAGLLTDDQKAAEEWASLREARSTLERQLNNLREAIKQHEAEQRCKAAKELMLKDDLEAAQTAHISARAEADELRAELDALREEREHEKEEYLVKEENVQRHQQEVDEYKEHMNKLAKELEAAQTELEVEQRQWEQDREQLQLEKAALEEERESLRQQIEAERSQMQEEQRAWEQERLRLDRQIADMEQDKQALEATKEAQPGDLEAMKLMSMSANDEGYKPLRTGERGDIPGLADLREEFETFRRERREAWQQGRKAHEQQERQWLQSYLGGSPVRSLPANQTSSPFAHPGMRPAGKVADWNSFRAVIIPLGTLVHLRVTFQRLNLDGSGNLDLHKLTWVEKQQSGNIPSIQADTLRSMIISMDATHSGNITFWEFVGVQLYLLLRLAERGFDFREWQTFVSKSWHPNHFQSRSIPVGNTNGGAASPILHRDFLSRSFPGP